MASRGQRQQSTKSLTSASIDLATRMVEASGGDPGEAIRRMAAVEEVIEGRTFASQEDLVIAMEEAAIMVESQTFPPETELEEANHMVFMARRLTGKRRKQLALDAVAHCSDCAEAYVLLGEEAKSSKLAQKFYQQAVEAAQRALGADRMKANAGHLSSVLEAGPYLRARGGLAESLWDLDQRMAAIAHLEDVLRLDSDDALEMRHTLASWLIATGDIEGLDRMIDTFPSDHSPAWLYSRALYWFVKEGPSEHSEEMLRDAIKANPLVLVYLFGGRTIPDDDAADHQLFENEEEEDAALIATALGDNWIEGPGVLQWVMAVLARTLIRPVVAPPPVPIGRARAKRRK